jgi:hypothetical protein
MNFLLAEILKTGMQVKCSRIGKGFILAQFAKSLLDEDFFASEIKGDHLFVLHEGKNVFIVCTEDDYIKFYRSPELPDSVALEILDCVFHSFLESFSQLNEDLIQLEESGLYVLPIITERHQ